MTKLQINGTGFLAFKGSTFMYSGTDYNSNKPIHVCKELTVEELQLIDDNPAILWSQEDIYHLLTS